MYLLFDSLVHRRLSLWVFTNMFYMHLLIKIFIHVLLYCLFIVALLSYFCEFNRYAETSTF